MKGKTVVIGLLGTLVAALGVVFWMGATNGGRGERDFANKPQSGQPFEMVDATVMDSGKQDGGVQR